MHVIHSTTLQVTYFYARKDQHLQCFLLGALSPLTMQTASLTAAICILSFTAQFYLLLYEVLARAKLKPRDILHRLITSS